MLRKLPITAEQFWRSSLSEVTDMLKGAQERDDAEWRRTAWMTSWLMNVSGNLERPITADELLTGQAMSHSARKALDAQVRKEREERAAKEAR